MQIGNKYSNQLLQYFFVLCLLCLAECLVAQGPISGFLPGKGNTDIALAYSYESFDEFFFGANKESSNTIITRSVNLFIEHGFEDSISVVVNLPFLWIDDVNSGLQDGSIFLKYRNKRVQDEKRSLDLITAVGLSLPLSSYPVDTETPIGLRATVFQGRFLAQYKFNFGFFLHLQTGVDFRISPTSQTSIPVLARIGLGSRKWYIDFWAEYYHTFNSFAVNQFTTGEGSRWLRAGGTLFYNISSTYGVFIGGAQIFGGRNIGLASRLNIGIAYKLR